MKEASRKLNKEDLIRKSSRKLNKEKFNKKQVENLIKITPLNIVL